MALRFGCCVLIVFLASVAVCQKPRTVTIAKQGVVQGKEISLIRTQRIYAFLGIPYAQPPLENLRFAPPKVDPMPSWDVPKEATEYAPACLQTDDLKEHDLPFFKLITDGKIESSEDCLYLNVFIPYVRPSQEGFATIVWIHPGNFTSGSPNIWNPYTLVYRHNVIVVTFAYRLNVMGFFTSMDGEAPGNFGLMDQQAALGWVKENIEEFGGNPDKICVMGYGAGATSIGLHLINPESNGLFTSAIMMGGSLFHSTTIRNPKDDEAILNELADYFGCFRKPTSSLMECLRRPSGEDMVEHVQNFYWRPMYDQGLSNSTLPFIPETPRNYFERGDFQKVPLLTGYTNMEGALMIKDFLQDELPTNASDEFVSTLLNEIVNWDLPVTNDTDICSYNMNHLMDSVMFFYGPTIPITDQDKARKIVIDFVTEKNVASSTYLLASYMGKFQPTYMYRFDIKPTTPAVSAALPEWVQVPHLFDLLFIWGVPYWMQLPDNQSWDIRDRKTADLMMLFWTNFAKYSNPTETATYPIKWDPFAKEAPGILIMDGSYAMGNSAKVNYKSFQFWNEYYPKVLDIATTCCNATDRGDRLQYFRYDFFLIFAHVLAFIFIMF